MRHLRYADILNRVPPGKHGARTLFRHIFHWQPPPRPAQQAAGAGGQAAGTGAPIAPQAVPAAAGMPPPPPPPPPPMAPLRPGGMNPVARAADGQQQQQQLGLERGGSSGRVAAVKRVPQRLRPMLRALKQMIGASAVTAQNSLKRPCGTFHTLGACLNVCRRSLHDSLHREHQPLIDLFSALQHMTNH